MPSKKTFLHKSPSEAELKTPEEYFSDENLEDIGDILCDFMPVDDLNKVILDYHGTEKFAYCYKCDMVDIDSPFNFLPFCRFDSLSSPSTRKICFNCNFEGKSCRRCR